MRNNAFLDRFCCDFCYSWEPLGDLLAPRWPPEGPKDPPSDNKNLCKSAQEAPRNPQEEPKASPGTAKRPPRAAKRRPRGSQDPPRAPQEAPKTPQEVPKRPPKPPKRSCAHDLETLSKRVGVDVTSASQFLFHRRLVVPSRGPVARVQQDDECPSAAH